MSNYLQYNQGLNYTLLYNVLEYFKTVGTNHPQLAKVTTGDIQDTDDREFPMYPLMNVNVLSTTFNGTTSNHEVQLVIADKIKNRPNESGTAINVSEYDWNQQIIDFYGVDDTVDILANTLAIANDITSFTQYSVASFDIEGDILCEPFVERFNNGLAGQVVTFSLTTHNDRPRCLYDLYPSSSYYNHPNC